MSLIELLKAGVPTLAAVGIVLLFKIIEFFSKKKDCSKCDDKAIALKHKLIKEQIQKTIEHHDYIKSMLVTKFDLIYSHEVPNFLENKLKDKYELILNKVFEYLVKKKNNYLQEIDLSDMKQETFDMIIESKSEEFVKAGYEHAYQYFFPEFKFLTPDGNFKNCGFPPIEVHQRILDETKNMMRNWRSIALEHKKNNKK